MWRRRFIFALARGFIGHQSPVLHRAQIGAYSMLPLDVAAAQIDVKRGTWGSKMRDPTANAGAQVESVIPFAPTHRSIGDDGADQLDKTGQSILHLLHRAAGVAEENSRYVLDMTQKLSHQLRAAEDRIAELEAEVAAYQDRVERAEQWLHKVYTEIEDRFLRQEKRRN